MPPLFVGEWDTIVRDAANGVAKAERAQRGNKCIETPSVVVVVVGLDGLV